ncbi:MAG: hypothetical protein K8T89_24760, partial [Planctomycetes bacterium]|nr:hypothetical protein [Planctomycetota bacterium]
MRRQAALLTLIFGLGFGSLMAVPLSPVSEQSKINQLIDQLGSANFRQREAASRELEAMGESALDPLRRATKHVDMEIAQRALSLVTTIEKKAENAKILAPTYVELTFKNTNVEEAVAVLSRKSGYQIVLGGDKTKLADRKVTFETGKVPFWMALDMLCEKANLVEGDASAVVNPGIDVPQPIGPIRVRPLPVQIQPIQIQPLQLKPIQIQPVPVPVQIEKPIQLQPVPAPVQIEKDAPAKPVPAPARPINNNRNIEKAPAPEGFAAEAPAKDEAPAKENAKPNFQPAQPIVQPLPVPPMMGRILPGRPVINGNGAVIVLVDGKSNPSPMHVAGAIRIREIKNAAILANFGQVPENEIGLLFEVKSEPKLQILHILGVKIDSAIDNYEQLLSQSLALNDGNTMNEFQVQEFAKRQAQLQIAQPAIAR